MSGSVEYGYAAVQQGYSRDEALYKQAEAWPAVGESTEKSLQANPSRRVGHLQRNENFRKVEPTILLLGD